MFLKIFIGIILLISPSIVASEITFPQPTGQYSVGTKIIEMRDITRKMFKGQEARRWLIQAFYPCNKHQKTSPYMPGTLKNGIIDKILVKTHSLKNATTVNKKDIMIRNDPDLLGETFPVIFFIPGIGSHHQDYTILYEELASQGYVVLAVGEPYVSNFIKFSDGTRIVYRFTDAWKHLWRTDREYRYKYFDDAMESTISDINYMLNHLDQIDQALTQTIENNMISANKTVYGDDMGYPEDMPIAFRNNFILDQSKIILMGHSFGGNVAHTLGFKDTRINAVIDIDSKITDRAIHGRIGIPPNKTNVPTFFIRGMMQYQENLGNQLTNVANSEIWLPMVEHSAFSDKPFLAAHIPTLFEQNTFSKIYAWLFKTGPQFDTTDINLGNFSIEQWYSVYRAKITSWLNIHIKRNTST